MVTVFAAERAGPSNGRAPEQSRPSNRPAGQPLCRLLSSRSQLS